MNAPRRVWGWSIYLEIPEPRESVLLRDAAQRVIHGESVFVLAREFNEQKVPTVYGGAWSGLVLSRISQRRTNSMGPSPLLSHEDFAAVVAALAVPRPRWRGGNGGATRGRRRSEGKAYQRVGIGRFVSTSVVRCTCGSRMVVRGKTLDGSATLSCRRDQTETELTSNHPAAVLDPIEEAVITETCSASGRTRGEFDVLTLAERRALAELTLKVTVESRGPHQRGAAKIERRAPGGDLHDEGAARVAEAPTVPVALTLGTSGRSQASQRRSSQARSSSICAR